MNVAIIAAAGQGARFNGGGRAKQFREISGTPIIIHTLRRFELCATIQRVIVVAPAQDTAEVHALAARYELGKVMRVVAGGKTRTESIWRGLQTIESDAVEVVAVHDGVRPFVTPEEIDRTVRAAAETGAAILAAPVVDTIKEARDGRITRTLERAQLWHAQTPQCFHYELLRRAYEKALAENIEATDDSALVERLGSSIAIVEGGAHNFKITRPQDIALAEAVVQSSKLKVQS